MMNGLINEYQRLQFGIAPQNITGAVTTTLWYNLAKARKICFGIMVGAWAGGTPAVTLLQAKDSAGGSSKALNFDRYWSVTGISQAATGDTWAETAVTNTNTFNIAAVAAGLYVVEVAASQLDINNAFNHVALSVASPGANTDLMAVFAILGGLTKECYPTSHPTFLD